MGQTRQKLNDRIKGHRNNPSNLAVHCRLTSRTITHTVRVLSCHADQKAADDCEKEEILALGESGLNRIVDGIFVRKPGSAALRRTDKGLFEHRKKRRMPRSTGSYRCSACRAIKTASEYYSDASRFNGLGSRCVKCDQERKKMMKAAISEGRDSSEGYREWKRKMTGAHAT